MITQKELKSVVVYNSKTGEFAWSRHRDVSRIGVPVNRLDGYGYKTLWIDGKWQKQHRLAWLYLYGRWPKDQIDHINGCRSDNRAANLREATLAENMRNRVVQKNNTSGYPRVQRSGMKYRVAIRKNGKRLHVGTFENFELAKAVSDAAADFLHGDFSNGAYG
jgi:hypothetical protein